MTDIWHLGLKELAMSQHLEGCNQNNKVSGK